MVLRVTKLDILNGDLSLGFQALSLSHFTKGPLAQALLNLVKSRNMFPILILDILALL